MGGNDNSMKVHVDIAKNRLYCTIRGKIGKSDMEKFYTDIRFGIADLADGFDVVTDLSAVKFGHLSAISTIRKIMGFIAENKVGEVVRIIEKKNILYRQALNFISYFQGYVPVYVETRTEAEEFLDNRIKRENIRFNLVGNEVDVQICERSFMATVINVSLGGCAVRTTEKPPELEEQLKIHFSLICPEEETREFDIDAIAVRNFDGGFACSFSENFNADREKFWQCLLHEIRSSK